MDDAMRLVDHCLRSGDEADLRFCDERRLSAPLLRQLIQQASAASVRIRGAIVLGRLDLRDTGSAAHPLPVLRFEECRFEADEDHSPETGVDLSHSHSGDVSLIACHFERFEAMGSHVHGHVDLTGAQPLRPDGPCICRMSRAIIDGDVIVDGVCLAASSRAPLPTQTTLNSESADWALNLSSSRLGGSLLSRELPGRPTEFRGGMLLDHINVAGDIAIEGAKCVGLDRTPALSLAAAQIGGSLTLVGLQGRSSEFVCDGGIWLYRARIAESFDLQGATLSAESDVALYALGTQVGGSCSIGQISDNGVGAVVCKGRIWIQKARVGATLKIESTRIALGAPSEPTRQFALTDAAELGCALCLTGAEIGADLHLAQNELEAGIDLRDVRCRLLRDSPAAYGKAPSILLDGLSYLRVDDSKWPAGRGGWLPPEPRSADEVEPCYRPQPYVQYASALAAAGEDHRAWDVLALKSRYDGRRRWLFGPSWGGSVVYAGVLLYGLLFKHGLSPSRALSFFVICILSGAMFFGLLDQHHMLVVSQTPVATNFGGDPPRFVSSVDASGSGTADVPCGLTDSALQEGTAILGSASRLIVYAADVFIPLVDLREEGKCEVGQAAPWITPSWLVSAASLCKALYAMAGWVVCTLALLTFSGVLRHRLAHG